MPAKEAVQYIGVSQGRPIYKWLTRHRLPAPKADYLVTFRRTEFIFAHSSAGSPLWLAD